MEYENQSITFDALVNTFLNIKNFCLACLTAKLCALCAKMCSHANMPCMFTCSCANVSCVLTCQRALNVYVLLGKTWENVQCTLVSSLYPDLSYFFIFTGFNTTPLMRLVKIILIRNRKSVEGD